MPPSIWRVIGGAEHPTFLNLLFELIAAVNRKNAIKIKPGKGSAARCGVKFIF